MALRKTNRLRLLLCAALVLAACAGTPGRLVEGGADAGTDPGGPEVTEELRVPCEPECEGKVCGPDGCGGTCGACGDALPCFAGVCECSDVVWVDGANTDDVFADGTDFHPFPDLSDGVAAACEESLVFVKPGKYAGGLTLGLRGVTLQGVSSDTVLVESKAGKTGIVVSADGVSVKNIGIEGGVVGLHVAGKADAPLMGIELANLAISGQTTGAGEGCQEADGPVGVLVENVNAVIISNTDISKVAGPGCGSTGEVTGIRLRNVFACTVENCTVTEVEGEAGTGTAAVGVALDKAEECEVIDTTVQFVIGGGAGPGAGGQATGISLDESADCLVQQCEILTITGGAGAAGAGGRAAGVSSVSGLGFKVVDSRIVGITGGAPGSGEEADGGAGAGVQVLLNQAAAVTGNVVGDVWGGAAESLGIGGSSAGVSLGDSTGVVVRGNLVRDIEGGCSWLGAPSFGVALDNVQQVTLIGNTISRIWRDCPEAPGGAPDSLPHVSAGVWARAGLPAMVVAVDTIISATGDYCLLAEPAAAGQLGAAFSTLHDCGLAQAKDATVSPECSAADPMFVEPDGNDYHLMANSPAIDAGSIDSDYSLEPEPNGCRANQGAYGNSPDATPLPGADHCPPQ